MISCAEIARAPKKPQVGGEIIATFRIGDAAMIRPGSLNLPLAD
jgi:hypothetical protein